MAIAITPFDGLCGFRPLAEITHFLATVPAFRNLIGDSVAKEFESTVKGSETSDKAQDQEKNKKALRSAFSALMNPSKESIAAAAKELVKSAEKEGESFAGGGGPSNGGEELADLVIRLNSQFEGDIGLFVLFFLNYVKLEVGEAMYLKADDIHAYLSGGKIVSGLHYAEFTSTDTKQQISWSAWHHLTMSFAPALPPSSRTFRP